MLEFKSHREGDLRNAMMYLPYDILRVLRSSDHQILLYSSQNRFGYCSKPDSKCYVIIINDHVFPNEVGKDDIGYRFFVFTVLHELAHAYMDITGTPLNVQDEAKADEFAETWFNQRAEKCRITPIKIPEMKDYDKLVESAIIAANKLIVEKLSVTTLKWKEMNGNSLESSPVVPEISPTA